MCGLAGVAGNIGKGDANVFTQLLYLSAFRGIDSTGIAVRSYDSREFRITKQLGAAFEFLDRMSVKSTINDANALMIGHCRSKTVGEVNKNNAQPFEFDNVVGTHNGTLSYSSKNRLGGPQSLSTDSMALYFQMDKQIRDGANDPLRGVLDMCEEGDAAALVWVDKKANTLNFYRNPKRPLHYTFNAKGDVLYWASEPGMLYLVLNRNTVAFKKVHELPENLHITFQLPEKAGAGFTKPSSRFQKVPPARPAANSTAGHGGRYVGPLRVFGHTRDLTKPGFDLGRNDPPMTKEEATAAAAITKAAGLVDQRGKIIPFPKTDMSLYRLDIMHVRDAKDGGNFYRSSNGKTYDKAQFEDKMFEGCAVCGVNPGWGEPVKFLKDEALVCAFCVNEAKEEAKEGKLTGTANVLLSMM